MKFPDPPILTDGKDPDIDNWLVQMRGKLEANVDHMPTDRQQMVYVQSRVGGLAMKHLQPRLRADAVIRFANAEEMFGLLDGVFGDPNQKLNARNKYRSLRQGDRDFNTFWSEFQLLAADLDHNEATLIDDLIYKSHHTIQRQLATGDEHPTSLREVAERYNKPKSSTPSGTKAATSTTTTATSSTTAPTFAQRMARPYTGDTARKLSEEEMDRCKAEGRCFNCQQVANHRPKCSLPWQPMVAGAIHEVAAAEAENA